MDLMEAADVARARVRAHHLDSAAQTSPVEVVRSLVAMQAQDYRGGLWSVGLRASHLTEAEVESALVNREIVRTWPMRGTLHLVAAEDARWLPALLGPRVSQAAAGRRAGLGLSDESVTLTRTAWERILADGPLGRPELFAAMDTIGVDSGDQRGPHLLRYFAEQGMVCFGPQVGNQPTYTLLADWVPDARILDRGEALAELALRYFTSHGPATLDDFAGWAFLTKTDARAGLSAVLDRLGKVALAGVEHWFGAEIDPFDADQATGVQLLPGFDEYVLGYKNRSAFMTPTIFDAVVPGGNGVFRATVLHDAQVVGTWTLTRLAKRQVVSIVWFQGRRKPPAAAVNRAVERYQRFCGVPTEWV